jgi:hypothetical protein
VVGITLSVTGAVIGTDPGEARDSQLYGSPFGQQVAQAALKNYSWTATSCVVDFQAVTGDIHKMARFWRAMRVHAASEDLVSCANDWQQPYGT